ncbi:unnamed protein product, partial [Musa hybrid cultivar]
RRWRRTRSSARCRGPYGPRRLTARRARASGRTRQRPTRSVGAPFDGLVPEEDRRGAGVGEAGLEDSCVVLG